MNLLTFFICILPTLIWVFIVIAACLEGERFGPDEFGTTILMLIPVVSHIALTIAFIMLANNNFKRKQHE